MSDKKESKETVPQEISISAENEILKGVYCNMARVSHNKNEFILDFIQNNSKGDAHLVSRVITNPEHMERLCEVMQNNLEKYKKQFDK